MIVTRERDHRDALRHLRDGRQLDRDLRLRHRGARPPALSATCLLQTCPVSDTWPCPKRGVTAWLRACSVPMSFLDLYWCLTPGHGLSGHGLEPAEEAEELVRRVDYEVGGV